MPKSLSDFARENPVTLSPEEIQRAQEPARAYEQKYVEEQTILELKNSVLKQLQKGNPPQFILFTAVDLIGMLTRDEEWSNEANEILTGMYADLAQQSLFQSELTTAEERYTARQKVYNAKLEKQLKNQLSGYRNVEKALKDALTALYEVQRADPDAEPLELTDPN